ncbi:hypothetical protein EEB15_26735 [Ramlibacter sp. WS9]|nr:hypothetical protein EEB15_26735 [Ramlibacter sp. WS9]
MNFAGFKYFDLPPFAGTADTGAGFGIELCSVSTSPGDAGLSCLLLGGGLGTKNSNAFPFSAEGDGGTDLATKGWPSGAAVLWTIARDASGIPRKPAASMF